jgi:hypothetical protein
MRRPKSTHPPGEPMTLGNMRRLGVQRLVATCLKDACRHQGLIDVSKYPDDTEIPSFAGKAVCAKCGAQGCDDCPCTHRHWRSRSYCIRHQ